MCEGRTNGIKCYLTRLSTQTWQFYGAKRYMKGCATYNPGRCVYTLTRNKPDNFSKRYIWLKIINDNEERCIHVIKSAICNKCQTARVLRTQFSNRLKPLKVLRKINQELFFTPQKPRLHWNGKHDFNDLQLISYRAK